MISSEEALLLFSKWRDESKVLMVISRSGREVDVFLAAVTNVRESSGTVSMKATSLDGRQRDRVIDLREATVEYADPREAPNPERSAEVWECFLQVSFPAGSSVSSMMFSVAK
ncbi:MAG TPA: hypothetical protein VNJ52_00155 [Patescibacteria group bacterium]|nr:hypothetical protein [Patescibacteria group bacterium]